MGASIKISIRELHARTGHYVRKTSGKLDVIITDHGKPVARLAPLADPKEVPYFAHRKLLPAFKKLMESGQLRGGMDSTQMISEDRDDH